MRSGPDMSVNKGDARQLGTVEAYCLERVTPAQGRQVTCSMVFKDYSAWCERRGFVPLREASFVEAFETLVREVGIPLRQRGSNLSFLDLALGDVARLADYGACGHGSDKRIGDTP
jgi:hypothetical protein